ncbi:HAMP domain-containing histidine kinase [Flavobacterium sp. AC]|uniref:histidine kinase n=1 Tax=Flavobacterium azizsancarii TaxID=2961580 RepID=A0ABT4WCN4_9FLAO|nr:HAMP domain-containing sensor histidine kinase [Flavobacterium azizsancarii]MDA6070273.1 HAMP domain-containing histidine kinase [Flavobacterium azizsancarii]
MIRKHLLNDTFSLLKLKFKHRKIIHYSLIAFVILLQLIVVIIWYNETSNESEMSKALDSMTSLNKISQYTGRINHSFIDSQKNFNAYKSQKDQASLDKYNVSLNEISRLVDSLSLITTDNKAFMKILMEKNRSAYTIESLKADIDSIIETQINPSKNNTSKSFKLNKFEYKKILDSIKTDSYIQVDSVSKKGLFTRLGNALAGKMDVQKEQLKITVTMKYNDKMVSGSIEDQFANLFKTTNNYYENQFQNLKKSFASLKDQDSKLTELNNKLLNLEAEIMPHYNKSLNTLQDDTQKQLQNQYNSNKIVRSYTIAVLIILMFIISIVLFSFTRMAFQYEKRLTIAQIKIRESLNFKNRIMGMVSHEIRSPLSIISIYSKMISSSIKDPEIKDTFKSIQFTTNSLLLLANQILEYSKDENYLPKLNNKNFHLNEEINQIIYAMTSLVESKGNKIEFRSNLVSDLEVYSDPTKIHQLFYNIIGNANKFTKDGLIAITIDPDKISGKKINLNVEIQDNGIGIAENDLKNIFELYYQGTVSGKVNDLGVGLGLNLCKEIVELFGGEISVQSQQGKGTTIKFNLIISLV